MIFDEQFVLMFISIITLVNFVNEKHEKAILR